MPFFSRSELELVSQSIEDLSTNTNLTRLGPGGKARAIVEAVNRRLSEAYSIFDINLARAFLSSAQGQYLDLFGDMLALPRLTSSAAKIDSDLQSLKFYVDSGTFGTINGGNSFIIPRGTVVSTKPNETGITFRILTDILCSSTVTSVWFSAEATIPGEGSNIGSNSLIYTSFIGYSDYVNNTLKVTNIHPVGNGVNFESDANYRYRLSLRVLEAEAANETAIRLAALSSPGVADIVLIPYYRGIGSFGIIIKSVTPTVSTNLIDVVTANVKKVQGLGTLAYIRGPKELGVSFKVQITYKSKISTDDLDTIEISLKDLMTNYVNSLDIGETLYLNRMLSELYTISSEVVNIGTTNKPFEESYIYKPTRLEDNKIRQTLLGDYAPESDERIIVEPGVSNPITFVRKYVGA
jgi:uncharacterized phage protein gp47/JayE